MVDNAVREGVYVVRIVDSHVDPFEGNHVEDVHIVQRSAFAVLPPDDDHMFQANHVSCVVAASFNVIPSRGECTPLTRYHVVGNNVVQTVSRRVSITLTRCRHVGVRLILLRWEILPSEEEELCLLVYRYRRVVEAMVVTVVQVEVFTHHVVKFREGSSRRRRGS